MFCEKCGSQIIDGAEFCGVCGAKVNAAAQGMQANAAPVYPQGMNEGYQQGGQHYGQQYGGYNQGYAPVQPAAQYQQAPQYYPAPAPAVKKPSGFDVPKGAYITMIILSAVAVGFSLMYATSLIILGYSRVVLEIFQWVFGIVPFFIVCLLSRKLPGFMLAIPILGLGFFTMVFFLSYIEYIAGWRLIFAFIMMSGVVLYFVTMLIKSRPLVMKIITAALLGVYSLYLLISDLVNIISGIGFYSFATVAGLLADIGIVCLYTAAIVYLFLSKPRIAQEN